MDLTSLAVFVAVVEHGGFSAAAQQLHLTQPAVSKRIAQLEAELGMRLLDRLGRSVLPTEAGSLLLERARTLLAAAADTRRAIAALNDGIGGTLRIATSHHIGLHYLPSLLRRYNQQFPQVELDIAFVDSEQAYAQVLDGRVELAITTLAPVTPPPLQ
ncbi:MAG: LysR family transcriptional regulator, partial [Stenotrophomonas koreensis]